MQEQVNKAMASLSETVGEDVPTFDEVREKIESRYAKAKGMSELTESSVESRMLEVEQAAANSEAQTRLAQIRAQLGLAPGAADAAPANQPATEPAAGARGGTGRGRDRLSDEIGVGPHPTPWPDDPRLDPELLADGRPPQRRRPLPLLDRRRHRRRPRRAPAPVPRGHRELGLRPQHRHGGAQRQRVPRRQRAHRRAAPVEPPRRDGHRPLPARAPTTPRSTTSLAWASGGAAAARRHRQPARGGPARDHHPPGALRAAVRPGGPGLSPAAHAACDIVCSIAQLGSTRSINAGVASGIAMHTWLRQHAL